MDLRRGHWGLDSSRSVPLRQGAPPLLCTPACHCSAPLPWPQLDEEVTKVLGFYRAKSAELTAQVAAVVREGREVLQRVRREREEGARGRSLMASSAIDRCGSEVQQLIGELTQLTKVNNG